MQISVKLGVFRGGTVYAGIYLTLRRLFQPAAYHTSMPAILCIDLLCARSKWRRGGADAALGCFEDFADLALDTASTLDVAAEILGDIEGDWCALVCPSPASALALGRRIFRRAWLETRTPDDARLWLRGIVIAADQIIPARNTEKDVEMPNMRRTQFTAAAMNAMTALRTGIQGMRLLVADSILNDPLRGTFRIPLGKLGVIPFRRMNFTPYPGSVQNGFQDFLWMAETPQEWGNYTMRIKQRMLWSAADPEEFAHAAATQVLFHECDSILQSVTRKNMQSLPEASFGNENPDQGLAFEA